MFTCNVVIMRTNKEGRIVVFCNCKTLKKKIVSFSSLYEPIIVLLYFALFVIYIL